MRTTSTMRTGIGLVTGLVLALGLGLAAQAPEGTAPATDGNTITVASQGHFEAAPDTAVVNWEITGENASLKAAYAQAQSQAEQVRALLTRQGFTPQQAHWTSYQVQPQWDYKAHRVTSYSVSTSLRLEFTDFQKIGPLLDAAGSAGLTALRGVSFELKDMDAARAAAIADGYRQTHQEAAALAAAAGRHLLGLSHASIDVAAPFAPVPMMARAMVAGAAAPPPTASFTPQDITVTARITAVYRLNP
jgi:hypothetical protein